MLPFFMWDVSEPDWVDFVFGFVVSENVDANPVVVFECGYVVERSGERHVFPVVLVNDFI